MKAGIYLHIPFCKSHCSYCDFATDIYRTAESVERYVNALIKEISNFKFQISDESKIQNPKSKIEVDTIFFGGGTPSLLSAKQLEKILEALHEKFSIDENSEITLEMNPATVSLETLHDYKSLGVNRASFGVQTFDDKALKILARGHDSADARKTFELLRRAGFENISFDLIAGLPDQTLQNWEQNLAEALQMNPEHLSLYLLEIHEGTPLYEQIRSKRQPLPDDDLAGEMYELMLGKIAEKGFSQYEISNFAKPSREAKHNLKYWEFAAYFSFGVSAHSFDGENLRWANERDTAKYVDLIEKGESAIVETTKLDEKIRRAEYAFLGLRLNKGVNFNQYKKKFATDLLREYGVDLERLRRLGLVESNGEFLRLTDKGRLFSNEVFEIFL